MSVSGVHRHGCPHLAAYACRIGAGGAGAGGRGQIVLEMRAPLFTFLGLCLVPFLPARAQSPGDLPGTGRWDVPPDLVTAQNTEMRRYFEARIEQAALQRSRFWEGAGWNQVVEQNREELRRMIGAVDQFLPPEPKAGQVGATPETRPPCPTCSSGSAALIRARRRSASR